MDEAIRQMKVKIIPATKPLTSSVPIRDRKMRVAAYCRVSTDSEEQINSYEAQKQYYTQLIQENPNWEFSGLFADAGITGTSMKKRDEFNRMIAACKRGRVDLILTKSLSRFSRNTVDCLKIVRMLKERNIGVLFEKENINTLVEASEFLITLHSGFAQAESEYISKNVTWGIRKSMEAGNVPIQYNHFLGYQRGPDGLPEVVPEEAEVVKKIYAMYIEGGSLVDIQNALESEGIPNVTGGSKWARSTIKSILMNEKYTGDAILQKTYRLSCIDRTVRKNHGELPMIYVENHHDAIISKEVFQYVQEEMTRRASKRKVMQKSAKTEHGKYSGKYALTERLVCGECGTPYKRCTWTIHGNKRIVWRCTSRLEYGKRFCHNSPTMEEEKLHGAILTAINQFVERQTVENAAFDLLETVMGAQHETGKSIADLQNEIAEISAKQQRLLDAILQDMDNTELNGRLKVLTDQKRELNQRIDEKRAALAASESDGLRIQAVRDWIAENRVGISAYNDKVTRRLVERIIVVDKKHISIRFVGEDESVDVGM